MYMRLSELPAISSSVAWAARLSAALNRCPQDLPSHLQHTTIY